MSRSPLRASRSKYSSRVTLLTVDPIKSEPTSSTPSTTASTSSQYTTLRRNTRSTTTPVTSVSSSIPNSSIDLSSYSYTDAASPSPRKKPKVEPVTPVKTESTQSVVDIKPKTPKSGKKPTIQLALEKPHPAPPKWEEQYRLIERMRAGIVAPVDDMGCERPRASKDADPKTLRFHMLISLMLSSQTKDPVTSAAVTNLHHTLPGGLTAQSLFDASRETVEGCINKVGFWRRKAEYIQEAAGKLLQVQGERKGDVPDTLEGLCELKGVGPKMAFLALQCAWNINAGIGVDVHVHRITNRLRWHKPQTTTPEQTRLNLQSWLPSHLHKPINPLMVGFGQVICLPVGPRCDHCLLGPAKLCPSYVRNVNTAGRKEVIYTFTAEDNDVQDGFKSESGDVKIEIGYEGLQAMSPELEKVKVEREVETGFGEKVMEEPGLKSADDVLEVLDEVDGVEDIGKVV